MVKWILLPLLWLLACIIAVCVLWRMWRGKPVLLKGRFSPRLVRMIVIILVTLGIGVPKAPAADRADLRNRQRTPSPDEALPDGITYDVVNSWLMLRTNESALTARGPHPWQEFKKNFVLLEQTGKAPVDPEGNDWLKYIPYPKPLSIILQADVEAMRAGKQPPALPASALLEALNTAEARGLYDHWVASYLWRKSATLAHDDQYQVTLMARLHRHARITNTLVRAHARIKPIAISPRAWMSKAGPRPAERQAMLASHAEMVGAFKALYPLTDTGTWERDGVVEVTIGKDSPTPTLIRGGHRQDLEPGTTVRLGRLDVLFVPRSDRPMTLEHAWLGPIRLGAGKPALVWELAHNLTPEGRIRAQRAILDALRGNEKSAEQLEQSLPLVHKLLREELARAPKAPGAPRLRLILSLFDEVVMPAVVDDKVTR